MTKELPRFHEMLLPILKYLGDGKEHSLSELNEYIKGFFKISDDDYNSLLPSGSQKIIPNRVGWAKTFLKKANLVEYSGSGKSVITKNGLEYLSKNPNSLSVKDLKKISGWEESWQKNNNSKRVIETELEKPPLEIIEENIQIMNNELLNELLDKVKKSTPAFFEQLVVDLMLAMGYGGNAMDAGKAIGKSGDGGIDGVIKQDKLGIESIYLQAKRYTDGPVGRKELQSFFGALTGVHSTKGVFITTSRFTKEAEDFVKGVSTHRVILIDGEELVRLMVANNVGVTLEKSYSICKIDNDYFEE
jgi:restriction system protein